MSAYAFMSNCSISSVFESSLIIRSFRITFNFLGLAAGTKTDTDTGWERTALCVGAGGHRGAAPIPSRPCPAEIQTGSSCLAS